MEKYRDELLMLAWHVKEPQGKHADRSLAFLDRVDEIIQAVEEEGVCAQRERDAQTCRDRAKQHTDLAVLATNPLLRAQHVARAEEATRCAEAITRAEG